MEIAIIFFLFLLNGVFSLSEIALVSSKKGRLESAAAKGNTGAGIALKLLETPEILLSAMQVGITLIGVVSGAYGGAKLSGYLSPVLAQFPSIAPYADNMAFFIVVTLITYFSIVIGELVPKTIALNYPEKVAMLVAPFVQIFTKITYPFVKLLSLSTKLILKMLFIKENDEQAVSEEELKMMIKMAGKHGVLEQEETTLHNNLFRFTDRRAQTMMTHRSDVEWIDISEPSDVIEHQIKESFYSKFLVCDENIDKIIGVLNLKDYIEEHKKPNFSLRSILKAPLYVPESMSATRILELFRKNMLYFGVVVDEYGSLQGIITLHDLVESIFGYLPDAEDPEEQMIVRRSDGSYLIDGMTPLDEIDEIPELAELYADTDSEEYTTISGLLIERFERIPNLGDSIDLAGGFTAEIVDMDGVRIDKVLLSKKKTPPENSNT